MVVDYFGVQYSLEGAGVVRNCEGSCRLCEVHCQIGRLRWGVGWGFF
jgi:hypothetical protein